MRQAPRTIRELAESSDPAAFTLGRIEVAVTHQGSNPWTLLRILHDYYSEIQRRSPSDYWANKIAGLDGVEAAWMNSSSNKVVQS